MKNIIVFVAAFCFAMVGFSAKVMAGPTPLSAQETAQLSSLASDHGLLTMKAGDSLPDAPVPLASTEAFALRNLSSKSRDLESLKGGEYLEIGLGTAVLIIILVILLVR